VRLGQFISHSNGTRKIDCCIERRISAMVVPIRPQHAAQMQSEFEFPSPKFGLGRKYSGEFETEVTIMRALRSKMGISFIEYYFDIEIKELVP
jgi:hypothetical protein